jgi:hypothetical protein
MKRLLVAAAILAMLATAHARPRAYSIGQRDQVTKGLVSYWSMRNSGTTVFDEVGANNGGASNGVAFAYANGIIGQGAWFDSTNDFVQIADAASLRITGDITIAAWVNVQTLSAVRALIAFGAVNDGTDHPATYAVRVFTNGTVNFHHRKSATSYDANGSVGTVVAGTWKFITVKVSGTKMSIFSDGALASAATSPGAPRAVPASGAYLSIGSRQDLTLYHGNIDEVRIYNRALSADEVKQLYRMGATIFQNR